jgi:ABC-2 type transport system ATP-binding protein
MMSGAHAIETKGLTKRFGKVEAVRELDLNVSAGQITGFLGRNGAGKTTTVKMLLGMTRPSAGTGTVLGRTIDDPKQNREMRRHVAYVGEDKQLYAYMTVSQLIRFTRSFYDDWRPEVELSLLKQYQLPLNRRVKALSKGMRTKLALLLAFSRRPHLLILDEPSEGLDPVSIEELLQTLVRAAGEGTTVFFSSHQIDEVERIADHICMIDHGSLILDVSLDELRQNYRRITLGFSSPPPEFKLRHIAGVEHVDTQGRQIALIANRDAESIAEHARRLGAVSVDVDSVSVRQLFLEKVKERPDALV